MTYFLFNRLPGMPPKWTMAVLAVSQKDARQHIRATWKGGTLCCTVTSGEVKADCGAVTDKAAENIHEQREREYWDSERTQPNRSRCAASTATGTIHPHKEE